MNRWMKIVFALLVCLPLGGCAISFDKVPSCSEEATLDLVRSVIADSVLGTNEKPSAQRLREVLRLTYPRATKLEENIKKYTCSADMVIEYDEGTHESEIIYESQLDDAGDHIVVVHNFDVPPELLIKSLIRVASDDVALDNLPAPESADLPTHCQQSEHTILDARFPTRGSYYKVLSLCSKDASPPFRAISYRFGSSDIMELAVDATSDSQFNIFNIQTAPRVGEDIIYFTRGNYSYYVGIATGMGSGITLRAFRGRDKMLDMFSGNDPEADFRMGPAEIDFHVQVRSPGDVLRWARPPEFMLEESSFHGSEDNEGLRESFTDNLDTKLLNDLSRTDYIEVVNEWSEIYDELDEAFKSAVHTSDSEFKMDYGDLYGLNKGFSWGLCGKYVDSELANTIVDEFGASGGGSKDGETKGYRAGMVYFYVKYQLLKCE